MSVPIEDHALIGDTETAALVTRDGTIDWLCLPRFDSPACFAALLGDDRHGCWRLAPPLPAITATRRRYLPGTLVLETEHDTAEGTVRITDAMPPRGIMRGRNADVVRLVEGVRGAVEVELDLAIRFDFGSIVPWVTAEGGALRAVGGPDALTLTTPVPTRGRDLRTEASFTVREGERVPFVLTWHPSYEPAPEAVDAELALFATESWWREWSDLCSYDGEWKEAVQRSLLTLKALTFAPSGGIVAAPTTSLPEQLGGPRNWDYRYVWLRDATFTLSTLLLGGYRDEAVAWRDWLLRAIAGEPSRMQIMYGVAGERRLTERQLDWLPGYEGSRPVREGNAASQQVQHDVYGEVMDALHVSRQHGIEPDRTAWRLQRHLVEHLESIWDEPDHGIWEVRGAPRAFTHSRVMTWVAFDRAVQAVEHGGMEGPVDRWRRLRDEVHAEVLAKGYDADRNTFVQSYGNRELDAALLLIPQVGFLPASDPRVVGTVDAIATGLAVDDVTVLRYRAHETIDGLPGGEGAFLLCSFWLVDALAMTGRHAEARRRFTRLLELRNDVGLLAEEYDPVSGRQLGNFPQAFSHLGLIDSAYNLSSTRGPATERSERA